MFLNFHTPAFQLQCFLLDFLDTVCGICSSSSRNFVTQLLHLQTIFCRFKYGDSALEIVMLRSETVRASLNNSCKSKFTAISSGCYHLPSRISLANVRIAASTLWAEPYSIRICCKRADALEYRITDRRWKETHVRCSPAS